MAGYMMPKLSQGNPRYSDVKLENVIYITATEYKVIWVPDHQTAWIKLHNL